MVKAVIFDLDDTLISERQFIKSGYRHLSKILSKRFGEEEDNFYQLLLELFNSIPKNVFNRLFDKLGINYTQENIFELVEEYRNHLPTLDLFEDVEPCLNELKNRSIKVGIITDGYASSQRQKLKAIKAIDFVNEIIVTDELGRDYWKPHPRAFEMMKEKMNVDFHEMIYVGDNPEKDFYIGKTLSIKTARIVRPTNIYKNRSYLHNVKENLTLSTLLELLDQIE
ncbi:MAG: HAD-IA family hydrolase [Firmicutes bacterium]|nr:HAD-IA family hydrolase [Bacillota bacterium]